MATSCVFNFAASNTLARQISEGAPADIFISADEAQMDGLQEAGFLLEGTRRRLLSNTLAVVVGIDSHLQILSPQQLAADTLKRLALADTRAVPAGVYAKEYLEKNGVWEAVKERVVPTENVRAALAAVESGNADAGIVYKTDATISKAVKIAYVVPPHEGPRISYPIAIIKNSGHPDAARRFVAYLTTEAAMAVFQEIWISDRRSRSPMSASEWQIVAFTSLMAALATLVILPPGVILAWFLARANWPGKPIVETLVTLPLVIPPVATGLILLKLLGRKGPIGGFLHSHFDFDIVFTWRAVIAAMAVMSFPLLVRGARIAFESVDPRLEQVAATLGASRLRIFLTITLPLAVRGIIAGSVLAFARALGEFGATILVAGNIPGRTTTLSVSIYSDIQLGHDGDALRLLTVSIRFSFRCGLDE